MATAKPRPCTRPGCPNRQPCIVHSKKYEKQRGTSTQRGYGKDWRIARDQFITEQYAKGNVWCACGCGAYLPPLEKTGELHVDHIIPHNGKQELFWDRSNWQMLTKRCHSAKTMRESVNAR